MEAQLDEEPMPEITQEESQRLDIEKRLKKFGGGGIGFCGAHRTGKSSLAAKLGEINGAGIPFVRTSTREIAAKFGLDTDNIKSFDQRLLFQEHVLLHHEQVWDAQKGMFFTDRTPLDMAAYMMASVPPGPIDSIANIRVGMYLNKCAEVAERHFMAFICVQPGIPYIEEPGAPAPNTGFQECINALVIGFARARVDRPIYTFDRDLTGFEERVRASGKITSKVLQAYQTDLLWLTQH